MGANLMNKITINFDTETFPFSTQTSARLKNSFSTEFRLELREGLSKNSAKTWNV